MKTLLLTIATVLSMSVTAQSDFEVPKNLDLDNERDYAKYEDEIIDCSN